MVNKTVEFWFDVGSPYSYLAYRALPPVAERCGARLDWRPRLLGGVFGAPTFFVGEQMFWGQDRLHFAQDALRGR